MPALALLENKKGLILGVANKRSIAWAIARAAQDAGAEVALTYATERFEQPVRKLANERGMGPVLPCDVTSDEAIQSVADDLAERWGSIDFVVHAVAFALREELAGDFHQTSREGYHIAQDVSAYSLTAVCRSMRPLMESGGSVLTLSYLGGPRVVPNYNVMGVAKAALEASVRYLAADLGRFGIRVNAVSAGPIKTLSAAGVSNFSSLLENMPERAPLRRNVTAEEVGDASVFLLSDYSRGVTGDILYVDAGYHVLGA